MAEARARLRDLHAMEVSLVPKAANQRRFLLLKMDGGEEGLGAAGVGAGESQVEKTVVPFQDLPLAGRDREWDARAAAQRVRAWASDGGEIDFTRYRQAFLWFDSENADNVTAYKLPYADVIDGQLRAVPRGIFAAAGVLQGARGGADIPQADQERIRGIVSQYYARMQEEFEDESIVPPWEVRQGSDDNPEYHRRRMEKGEGHEMTKQQFLPVRKEDGAWDFTGIPEEVRPTVEALWKQNEEAVRKAADLEGILKEERDQRLTREYIAKAAELTSLPVKADEFGPVLKALAEKAPEEYARIESLLKAANEQLRQVSLFAEMGKSGSGAGGSAWGKIEAAATSLVQKSEGRMTREQAIAEIMQLQPELYNEYLRERGAV